jgi:subtilisin family serine protease
MRLTRGRKCLVLLGYAALLLVLSGASHQAQGESPIHHTFKAPKSLDRPHVPGEVLVKFKESPATFRGRPSREHLRSVRGAAAAEFVSALPTRAQASLERVQGQVVRAHPHIGMVRVKLPAQVSVGQAIETLYRSGAVEYAEPNALIIPQATPDPPSDPQFVNQWNLFNDGSAGTEGADIKALYAWGIITGGNNAIVAVIDSGVDYYHEDLALNMWVNANTLDHPGEIANDGIDNDINNFVDDYFGINTATPVGIPSTGDPMDTTGHGTAMAGIIGAVGNNSTGMAGVNWQAKIMALKCMTTSGDVENAITCINYALSQRAKEIPTPPMVLTLGWSQSPSYSYSKGLYDALRIAQDAGVLVVAAAGNNNEDNDIFPNYPSSYFHDVKDFPVHTTDNITLDNIISVGASDQFDQKETNSSYGMATVDLFAPGKSIPCTTPGNKYSSGTGTSYAAAHVAGACALLWSRYPNKDWRQIKAMILNGAEDGMAQDFRAICVTEGRLNLANSLNPAIETAPAVFSIFQVAPTTPPDDPVIVPGRADTSDTLVITGVNFGTSIGILSFLDTNFSSANIVSWWDDKIIATVPAGLAKGTGRLLVTNATSGLTSRGGCFSNISRERQVGSLIMGRGLAASAQVNKDVWVIGGRTYWGIVGQVEKYSLNTNHTVVDSDWMMPTPVSNAGAASIGAKIYVVGGATEDPDTTNAIPVANLQIFDTVTRTWATGPPLPKALMQCAVTSIGNKLYAFGGMVTPTSVTKDAYVFDPAANAWGVVTSLPTATAYAAAAPTAAGKIWVMGGFSSSIMTSQQRLVQEYDPVADTWTQQRHLVRPRGGAAGLNHGGQVYCLHGTKYPPAPFSSAVYDGYADGEWYNLAQAYWMPSIMNYLGIFVAPPKVLDRKGLYTPSPGKYLDKIFLLGGVTGTETDYKYSYSNKVWAFPAPGGVKSGADMTPILNLLLESPE